MPIALITGITGQDGSYLAEFLLSKGYQVHGLLRRQSSIAGTWRIDKIFQYLHLHHGDITDGAALMKLVRDIQPDEVYNLAAQSHVKVSFETPYLTAQVTGLGTLNVLEAVRFGAQRARLYQASSSEQFGRALPPQNEQTPFMPQSPYAAAKVYAHTLATNYRDAYGMFVCCGILFNHTSPRRGETFISRKVARAVAAIKKGTQDKLYLGTLTAKRDWGWAPEYCIDLDVPILTPSGWRYRDELSIGDVVINFDPSSNTLKRDAISNIIDVQSDGERVVFQGRGLYLRCTKDHRVYYQQKRQTSKGGWTAWKEIRAIELFNLLNDKAYRTKYDYRLPGVFKYTAPDNLQWNDDQIYLIGCLLAEGHLHRRPPGKGIEVSLSQSFLANEATAINISKTLSRLNLHATLQHKNGGTVEWCLTADDSRTVLSWFDVPNVHIMPRWCFNLSERQALILFTALMDCDGHWGSMTYTSKRYMLAVDFQTVALLAGYRTSKVHTPKTEGGCYTITALARNRKYAYIKECRLEKGDSEVWCVTTANKTIVTRDNDCIALSGNCESMWAMLQQDKPDDYVIATGESHFVSELCDVAFAQVGLDWREHVEVDLKYNRPLDVWHLEGDATKARVKLGWEPRVRFHEIVRRMVAAEMNHA